MSLNEDKSVTVTLASCFADTEKAAVLMENFANWKHSIPMAVSKKGSVKNDLNNGGEPPHRLSDVMLRILAFPVEQKTPMECMGFITEIKQQLTRLL